MLTAANSNAETRPHTVLRAICMAGQRVEVGEVVHLTRTQAQDLAAAGKVSPQPVELPAEPAPAEVAAEVPPKTAPGKGRGNRAGG